jgi:4-amino-4-deoxy-L-arabinose transferase-like glycosyltransferase
LILLSRWTTRQGLLLLLFALAVVPYFVDLGGSSIWDANEAFYVETPREMLERGDYIAPTFNYQPRLNKPVLSYWIVGLWYEVFGVSVLVQRIPIALAGVTLVLVAFVLGRVLSHDYDVAILAGMGLAAGPRLFMFARRIFIDMYVSMFMALTLMCFALAERYPEKRRGLLIAMYVCIGLGVLTKGPVAIVLPALAFGVYLLACRELRRIREMMVPLGLAIVLAIVTPWYAALYSRYGWKYITEFFVAENLERYASGVGSLGRGPLFYVPVVFTDSLPLALFLVAAAAVWFSDYRRASMRTDVRLRTLLWSWIATIVLFFSFSQTKQDLYVFPITVAIAALGADAVVRALASESPASRVWVSRTALTLGALLFAAGLAIAALFEMAGNAYVFDGLWWVAGVTVAGGLGVLAMARKRLFAAVICIMATFITLNWLLVVVILPGFERYKPVPPLADAIARRMDADDVVVHYDVALPSMVFYLRRHIEVYFDRDAFLQRMRSDDDVFAVLTEDRYAALKSALPAPTCVIDRRPTADVKLRSLLEREPPPNILLITNRCS